LFVYFKWKNLIKKECLWQVLTDASENKIKNKSKKLKSKGHENQYANL
jgi:hypothetical protein